MSAKHLQNQDRDVPHTLSISRSSSQCPTRSSSVPLVAASRPLPLALPVLALSPIPSRAAPLTLARITTLLGAKLFIRVFGSVSRQANNLVPSILPTRVGPCRALKTDP